MKTNFRELNNASEACPVKKRNIVTKDSRENYVYKKAVAVLTVVAKAIELPTVQDIKYYTEKVIEEFKTIEFPTHKTYEGFVIESALIIKRYHQFVVDNGINPILDVPSLNLSIDDVDVDCVKPTYMYVKGDTLHVVKVKGTKPDLTKVKVFKRKDLYVLMQYGRKFIPQGKALHIVAEFHFLRCKDDTTQVMAKEFDDDKNVYAVSDDYGLLPSIKLCKKTGNACPCMVNGKFIAQDCPFYANEDGCLCEHMTLQHKNDIYFSEELTKAEECTEEDCKNCSMNAVCSYKKAPLYVPSVANTRSLSDLNLSAEQEEAIGFRKGVLKINAGAGAGKTVVVAARVACMLNEGISPESMLLITFTNTGAKEMKERIALYCDDFGLDIDMDRLTVTTFNSFGQQIIDSEWANLGYTRKPILIDDVERYGILADLLNQYEIRGIDYRNFNSTKGKNSGKGALEITKQVFGIIKSYNLSDDQNGKDILLDKLGNDARFISSSAGIDDLFKLYDKYYVKLKEENFIEFADQENLIFEVLRQNPYFFEDLGLAHITIDEFQDTSDKQMNIIKELVDTKDFESLMVVGDDSQAIFSFRDTTPEYIINFFEHLGLVGDEIYLTDNHRSTPEILNLANKINSLNKDRVDKDLNAARNNGPEPVIMGFWDKLDEYEWIVDKIKEKIETGTNPEDIAFIASNKNELLEMASMLAEEGIPTILLNPENLMENSRIQGALALTKWLQEPSATQQALIYANCLERGSLLEKTDDEINNYIENLSETAEKYARLSGDKKREYFHELLEELDDDDEIYQSFIETLKGKMLHSQEIKYCSLFSEYGAKEAIRRVRQYNGVVLTTAHSSKGLEWKIVFNSISKYFDKNIDVLRRDKREKAIEEKRRLLFVSTTRARDELFITGKYVSYGSAKEGYKYNIFLNECYELSGMTFMPVAPSKEEKEAKKLAREEKKQHKNSLTA